MAPCFSHWVSHITRPEARDPVSPGSLFQAAAVVRNATVIFGVMTCCLSARPPHGQFGGPGIPPK